MSISDYPVRLPKFSIALALLDMKHADPDHFRYALLSAPVGCPEKPFFHSIGRSGPWQYTVQPVGMLDELRVAACVIVGRLPEDMAVDELDYILRRVAIKEARLDADEVWVRDCVRELRDRGR